MPTPPWRILYNLLSYKSWGCRALTDSNFTATSWKTKEHRYLAMRTFAWQNKENGGWIRVKRGGNCEMCRKSAVSWWLNLLFYCETTGWSKVARGKEQRWLGISVSFWVSNKGLKQQWTVGSRIKAESERVLQWLLEENMSNESEVDPQTGTYLERLTRLNMRMWLLTSPLVMLIPR